MDYLREYLGKAKEHLMGDEPVRIVMGNNSGDVDSIVGALGLAYFYHLRYGQMWIPIVNCDKDNFPLSTEIYQHVITDCELEEDDLVFWD